MGTGFPGGGPQGDLGPLRFLQRSEWRKRRAGNDTLSTGLRKAPVSGSPATLTSWNGCGAHHLQPGFFQGFQMRFAGGPVNRRPGGGCLWPRLRAGSGAPRCLPTQRMVNYHVRPSRHCQALLLLPGGGGRCMWWGKEGAPPPWLLPRLPMARLRGGRSGSNYDDRAALPTPSAWASGTRPNWPGHLGTGLNLHLGSPPPCRSSLSNPGHGAGGWQAGRMSPRGTVIQGGQSRGCGPSWIPMDSAGR